MLSDLVFACHYHPWRRNLDKCVDTVQWQVLQVIVQDLDEVLLLCEIHSTDTFVAHVYAIVVDVVSSLHLVKSKIQCCVYSEY